MMKIIKKNKINLKKLKKNYTYKYIKIYDVVFRKRL